MHRACVLIALCGGLVLSARAEAQSFRYPRVYGSTGRPYGPTRAHEQYQRQYGRAWHGQGGATAYGYTGSHFTIPAPTVYPYDYPFYGYGAYGYYGPYGYGLVGQPGSFTWFGTPGVGYPTGYVYDAPSYQVAPFVPPLYQDVPPAETPFENEVLFDALRENDERWNQPLDLEPERAMRPAIRQSSPDDKVRSARAQAVGDDYLHKHNFAAAYQRYKTAVSAAPDRPEARARLAITLAAIGRYQLAAEQFKTVLEVDPLWPQTGESLMSIFGERGEFAKNSVLLKVVAWVREDIRDPDRLFLLGVLVYFDGNTGQAQTLFETALRLAGGGEHLKVFLRSAEFDAAPEQNLDVPPESKDGVPPLPAPDDGGKRPAPDDAGPRPERAVPPPPEPHLPLPSDEPQQEELAPEPKESAPPEADGDSASGPRLQSPSALR
jgi:hypothetical protein